jgi:DNA-directed RNA polymerase specialized sigma24 family protein
MRKRDFTRYHARYELAILGMARKLGGSDDALVEDLAQEGRFALYRAKPELALRNRDAWLRKLIWNKLVDYLRKNDIQRYESLDARLVCGDQLGNGDVVLITNRPRPPKLIDEDEYMGNDDEEEG